MNTMKRREFLIGAGLAAGAGKLRADRPDQVRPDQARLDRIAIMSLCFNPVIKSPAHPDDSKRTLDILDLPDMIAERYGVHHVELQHSHFASTEPGYLEEYRGRLKKAKSQMNQINVEFGTLNISSPDPVLRLETIDLTKKWIDHAVILGCPRIMVNQGTLAPEVRQAGHRHLEDHQCVRQNEKGVHHDGESRRRRRRTGRTRRNPRTGSGGGSPNAAPSAIAAVGGCSRSNQGIRNMGQSRYRKLSR